VVVPRVIVPVPEPEILRVYVIPQLLAFQTRLSAAVMTGRRLVHEVLERIELIAVADGLTGEKVENEIDSRFGRRGRGQETVEPPVREFALHRVPLVHHYAAAIIIDILVLVAKEHGLDKFGIGKGDFADIELRELLPALHGLIQLIPYDFHIVKQCPAQTHKVFIVFANPVFGLLTGMPHIEKIWIFHRDIGQFSRPAAPGSLLEMDFGKEICTVRTGGICDAVSGGKIECGKLLAVRMFSFEDIKRPQHYQDGGEPLLSVYQVVVIRLTVVGTVRTDRRHNDGLQIVRIARLIVLRMLQKVVQQLTHMTSLPAVSALIGGNTETACQSRHTAYLEFR